MGQDKPFVWKSHWEQLEWAQKLGGRASRNHWGGTNSVSHVAGVSEVAPTCQLCGSVGVGVGEVGLRKGTMSSASTSLWEKAAPQLSP